MKHSRLLDPHDTHPSPPAVFALSCDSKLLLSTSLHPPTIHLRNIATNGPPVLVRPSFSPAAVVAANFHPERQSIFILAFSDGSIAVLDAAQILRRNGTARQPSTGILGVTSEIASMKRLHTPTTKSLSGLDLSLKGYDPATGSVSVTGAVAGVTSVVLLPGHSAMAVTVGSDGKCCVVDFSQPNKRKAVLLRTWHLRRPATCLSVVYSRRVATADQVDGVDEPTLPLSKDYYIAVGRQDGKVLLFDLDGTPLGKRILDSHGSRVVDVEWARKENNDGLLNRRTDHTATKSQTGKELSKAQGGLEPAASQPADDQALVDFSNIRKSFKKTPLVAATQNSEVRDAAQKRKSLSDDRQRLPLYFAPLQQTHELDQRGSTSKMEVPPLFHERTAREGTPNDKLRGDDQSPRLPDVILSTPKTESLDIGTPSPAIPPRPRAKPGGRWHTRRTLRALEVAGHQTPQLNQRQSSQISSCSIRRISTAALPKTKVMLGRTPRKSSQKMSRTLAQSSRQEAEPRMVTQKDGGNQNLEPILKGSSSPATYTTASSRLPSTDASSTDTVVDWSAGLRRQPVPTLQPPYYDPSPEPRKPDTLAKKAKAIKKENTKGHISLDVSSESMPTPSDERPSSTDTLAQWPKYNRQHRIHVPRKRPSTQDQEDDLLSPTTAPNPHRGENPFEADPQPTAQHPKHKPLDGKRVDSATALILSEGAYSNPVSPERIQPLTPQRRPLPSTPTAPAAQTHTPITSPTRVPPPTTPAPPPPPPLPDKTPNTNPHHNPNTNAVMSSKPAPRGTEISPAAKMAGLLSGGVKSVVGGVDGGGEKAGRARRDGDDLMTFLDERFDLLRLEIREGFRLQREVLEKLVALPYGRLAG